MDRTLVSSVILLSLLVVTVSNLTILTSDDKNNTMKSFSFIKTAYAQNANTSDDSAGLGISSDNPLASVGLSDNSTNSTVASGTNLTSSVTTPEFGSLVPVILAVSIISIILISARTKLRLD